MFTGFVAIFIFPTVKDGIIIHCYNHIQIAVCDTFEIFNHFLIHCCKFAVNPNGTVFIGLLFFVF